MENKNTLTMPKTDFEMRGNLPNKEPQILARWMQKDLYGQLIKKSINSPKFILHDGPPYANGDIHIGHALNKVLKDFVIRYKFMMGYHAPFIPGWDTHGLPIETALTKKGVNRKAMPLYEFRELCMQFAMQQVDRQKAQFIRIGSIGDYNHEYITLQKEFEAEQIRIFSKMALQGLIYKGLKPVYWSPSSESALAEAEIEYHDVTSTSIYVAFSVKDGKKVLKGDEKIVIWTTTPWTLPANLAICLNANMTYGVYHTNRGKLIFSKDLATKLAEQIGLEDVSLIKEFLGSELEGVVAKHPFYDRDSLVILGDHVTNDSGTGAVHTAPGHGSDDFIVGNKYGIKAYCPVNEKGVMTEQAGERLSGLYYEAANQEVLNILKENNCLLKEEKITHSYPHDWRTKKPIIFRATWQWFASIEPIREELMNHIENVNWYPSWGKVRMHNMISDRQDWCISRQRAWGVPIPIIYNQDDTPIIDQKVFEHFAALIQDHGSNIWFKLSAEELLPKGYKNPSSPDGIFRKETDIMDVWFDSGSSSFAVIKNRGIGYPADLYLEGSDQYRGWFNSSLIVGTAYAHQAPYKNVVSHGFILDGNDQKMSKSLGNTVDPNSVASTLGADILRLWIATVAYQSDVKVSNELLKQVSESYRKIRNTFKFLLGNLSDFSGKFNYPKDKVEKLEFIDQCILEKLKQVNNNYLLAFDRYDFANGVQEVMNFMANDLSSFYLDITKDILYCDESNSKRRRQVQTVIYQVSDVLMRLLAPVLPFTMDEVYQKFSDSEDFVQLLSMPKTSQVNLELLEEYQNIKLLRSDVLKALEEARTLGLIGSSQEAEILYTIKEKNVKIVMDKINALETNRLFIVSNASLQDNDGKEYEVSTIKVNVHQGVKCERCWNRYDSKLISPRTLCPRCQEVVDKLEKEYE